MATASGFDSQVDLLTCILCYEMYNHTDKTPKGLPCMHTFCVGCLEKFVKSKSGFHLTCPLCQAKFIVPKKGAEALPTNILAKQLLDNLSVNFKAEEPSGRCQQHNKVGEFVCQTCHVFLCDDCIIGLSRGPHVHHTLAKVQVAVTIGNSQCRLH